MKNSQFLSIGLLLLLILSVCFSLLLPKQKKTKRHTSASSFVSMVSEDSQTALFKDYRLLLDGEPLFLPTPHNAQSSRLLSNEFGQGSWRLFKDFENIHLNTQPLKLPRLPNLWPASTNSLSQWVLAYQATVPTPFRQARNQPARPTAARGQIEVFHHGSTHLAYRAALKPHYFKGKNFYQELISPSEFHIYINEFGLISFPLRSKKSGNSTLDSSLRRYIILEGSSWGLPPGYYRVVIGA